MNNTKQINQEEFIKFLTAGNATFTIKSLKTGNHYTYKVQAADDKPIFFIKFLNGPDNTSNFKELAILQLKDGVPELNPRSIFERDKLVYKAFDFVFWRCLIKLASHPGIEIWHEGRCCRCGRKLTVPESIESGIGPECATKSFIKYF